LHKIIFKVEVSIVKYIN